MLRGRATKRTRQAAAGQAQSAVEHHKLTTLVNSLTDAVISTDGRGVIGVYNAAAINLLDTNTSIAGKLICDVVAVRTVAGEPVDIRREMAASLAIRTRDDLVLPLDDDDQLRLEVTFAPILGSDPDEPDGYVLILRDITKAKSLEEERDEFISVVSHELRTPVAIAEGSLDNARLLFERGYTDKARDALAEAYDQVIFLSKMVNDLSTLSRAERGIAGEPEEIAVEELARLIYDEYAPQAEAKGLQFNLSVTAHGVSVLTSRLYLQELLQNFITNAIKYTQAGSVTLRIALKDGQVLFAVTDTGIGIGRADQEKIFQRFYRAEDYRTRETSGTGLGLYVAAKLARKLGCRIAVKSRLNHGSTFSISLPAARPHDS